MNTFSRKTVTETKTFDRTDVNNRKPVNNAQLTTHKVKRSF